MPLKDDQRTPRVRLLLLITAFLIAVLSFGQPLAAYADPTPSSSDAATPDAKKADTSSDPSSSDSGSGDPKTATPTQTPSSSPTQDKSAEPTTTPSTEPSSKQSSENPTTRPSTSPSATTTPSSRVAKKVAVEPKVVPPATGNNAVITVKVGGNRFTQTAVSNLAGVQLGLYASSTSTTALFTCTSDADGDCSFTIPNTQTGGANRDARYFVRQISTASGYFTNPNLGTGTTVASDQYQFQTGTQLRNGTVYSSTVDFMVSTGNTNNEASGGVWQNSLNNPTIPAKCGLNVAILHDLSNSVTSDQLVQMKAASTGFVDALTGTPSQVGTFTFATAAPAAGAANATLPLTSVSTAAGATTVKNRINGMVLPGGADGGTNWDRGLYQVAQSSSAFDVLVVITDGSPTYYGDPVQGPGNRTRFRETENGIFSANGVKGKGTRIVAVGVGDGVGSAAAGLNLRSISGTTLNSDYYQTNDYAAAGAALRALALGSCQGSVTVVKQVVPSTTATGSTTGAQPQGGWVFTGSTTATGVSVNTPVARTTDATTGAVNFPLTFTGGTTSGAVQFVETLQAGYTLHQGVTGQNAVCRNVSSGANIVPGNVANGFTVAASSSDPISCTVYNKAPVPLASVIVNKTWRINGTDYAEGSQPTNFAAGATIAGTPQGWGVERTGFRLGDTPAINETISNIPPQCTLTSNQVVLANGATIAQNLPYSPTLAAGQNTYTIRNVVSCQTKLTLTKSVQGGTEPITSWTLNALAPTGALAGPTGTSGSAGATGVSVTPGTTYPLAETGTTTGALNYIQFVDPNAVLIPGSTGSWTCQEVGTDGTTVIPGFSDGLNGGVTVPLGKWVRCNAINRTSTMIMKKIVQNTHGGTAVPANWTLTATPTGSFPAGLPAQSVTGSTAGASFNVRPGVSYAISEAGGPAGYSLASTVCDNVPGNTRAVSDTLNPLDTATCTFTNVDTPATLTLVKTVTNDNGGTAQPTAWTLAATGGPTTGISGATGSAAVTNVSVSAGSYTLAESGGPAGYTAGNWSCTGGTLTGSAVAVVVGANVVCTINNDDQQAHLTLVKTVTNGNGGTAVPTAWTLSATGPTTISGVTGSTAVTNASVSAGTYTLAESGGPSGYTASTWSCTAGTLTGASLVLPLNTSATCTINNNDISPKLTLVKTVTNDNGGTAAATAWTLAAAGPTNISGVTGAVTVTNASVKAGTYTLSESGGPAGYTAGAWSCTGGTLTGASLVLTPGVSATCRINNDDKPATLSLVKVVNNGTTGATAVPSNWTLTATGPTPITGPGNTAPVTGQTVNAGAYVLSESGGPAGYTAGAWTCTGGTVTGNNVVVPNGGTVSCTITNTAQQPQLTLVKIVDNGATGATTSATAWTLSAVGPQSITGVTGSATITNAPLPIGQYDLTESGGPAGYSASTWTCTGAASTTATSVTLGVGSSATCTITNTAQQPHLTLVKTVTNDNGGTAVPTAWTLTATGPTTGISGPVGNSAVTNVPVRVGSYTLAESGGPTGYLAGAWSCTGGGALSGNTLTVPLNANITCTINNDDQPAHLTLIKTVTNTNGGTAVATAWTLTATGPTTISGITGSGTVTNAPVSTGTYALSESGGPSGYTAGAWSCTAGTLTGSSLALPLNTSATCTINNNDQPAHLTLVKTVTNDNGGTAVPTAWTLTAAGPITISGTTGSGPVTNAAVRAGTYALTESGPSGYAAGAWSCSAGTLTGSSLVLGVGVSATCTINNDDKPATLSLIKVVNNGTTGSTAVPSNWTLTATGSAQTITGPGNSPAVTNQTVNGGTYSLSESGGQAGYTASAWSCTGGTVTGSNVAVPNGGNVSCTITNTAQQPTLTLVKIVANDGTGGTAVPANWTLSAVNGGTLVSGPGNSAQVTNQPVPVGDYSLSESGGPAGYTAGTWSCTGGAAFAGSTVTLAAGSSATCTITNTAQQAHLTLVKTVTNDNGGAATPNQWTLSATGPTGGISGPTGSGSVTGVAVEPRDVRSRRVERPGRLRRKLVVLHGWDAERCEPHPGARPERHLHDQQQRSAGHPYAGQDRHERQRRHRGCHRVDAVGHRTDDDQRSHRDRSGDRRPGRRGDVHPCRDRRPGRIHPRQLVLHGRQPHRSLPGAAERRQRDLHHRQRRSARHADPGQDRHQRQRRHRSADRLDAHRDRPDRHLRRDRVVGGDRGRRGRGIVRSQRVGAGRLHAGRLDLCRRQPDGLNRRPALGWGRDLHDRQRRPTSDLDAGQDGRQRYDRSDLRPRRLDAVGQRTDRHLGRR